MLWYKDVITKAIVNGVANRKVELLGNIAHNTKDIAPFMMPVPPDKVATMLHLNPEHVKQYFDPRLFSEEINNIDPADIVADVPAFTPDIGTGILRYMDNGKVKAFQVTSPELFETLRQYDDNLIQKSDNTLTKFGKAVFSAPKKLTTITVTKSPWFPFRNTIRDTQTWFTNSKIPMKSMPKFQLLAGKEILMQGKYYHQYLADGGANDFWATSNPGETPVADYATKLVSTPNKVAEALYTKLIDERFYQASELQNRLAEYIYHRKLNDAKLGEEKSRRIAAHESLGVTVYFGDVGRWTKQVGHYVPFGSANVAALKRMYEGLRDRPKQTIGKALLLQLPLHIAVYEAYKDKKWYKELPKWFKASYIPIKTENGIIQIPVDYSYSAIFGEVPTSLYQYATTGDVDALKQAGVDIAQSLLPPYAPEALTIPGELLVNKDFFTGQYINPPATEGMSAKYKIRPGQHDIVVHAVQAIHDMLNKAGIDIDIMSPAQASHILYKTLGKFNTLLYFPDKYIYGSDVRARNNMIPLWQPTYKRESKTIGEFYDYRKQIITAINDAGARGEKASPELYAKRNKIRKYSDIISAMNKAKQWYATDQHIDKNKAMKSIRKALRKQAYSDIFAGIDQRRQFKTAMKQSLEFIRTGYRFPSRQRLYQYLNAITRLRTDIAESALKKVGYDGQ